MIISVIKQITTKEEKELFKEEIKKDLKEVISNVDEDDSYENWFNIYNSKEECYCILGDKKLFLINEARPININHLYYLGRIQLNKKTTDEELDKFANNLIKEYNERVRDRKYEEWYDKMLEKGMIEEDEDNSWHYTDKYYDKHRH